MAETPGTNKPDFRNGFPIRDLRDGSMISGRAEGEDRVQRPKPLTDFYGEDRHELVQKLAYQHWEKRGSPLWSAEIDWFAAEEDLRACLLASGIELGPDEDLYS